MQNWDDSDSEEDPEDEDPVVSEIDVIPTLKHQLQRQLKKKSRKPRVRVSQMLAQERENQVFKPSKTFNIIDSDQRLHWISQINDKEFSLILKKITNIPSFDVKQLWDNVKSERSKTVKKTHVRGHKGQKNKKHIKKIDTFRAQNEAKIANGKLRKDTELITQKQFRSTDQFKTYKSAIVNMTLPETQLAMKIKVFKHLI